MILLIFPHQLFAKHPGLKLKPDRVCLVEDSLFFGDDRYPMKFHKQKLWLHRATLKRYEQTLTKKGLATYYREYNAKPDSLLAHMRWALKQDSASKPAKTSKSGSRRFIVADPTDFMLAKRLRQNARKLKAEIEFLPSPLFLNSPEENEEYRLGKKRWFMADFYKWQRKRFDVLIDDGEPVGGRWSFDEENRKKVPKKLLSQIPPLLQIKRDEIDLEAKEYVERRFTNHPGQLDEPPYPSSHRVAKRWLKHFLEQRLTQFGDYEDAIVQGESWLWHSILTPMLNIGLLTPQDVLQATLDHASKHDVPLSSLEGFVRQVIGWREFMRATSTTWAL